MALNPGTTDADFQGKLNTLRTLPSRHGIELGFFSRVQNDINPHVEPEFAKVIFYRFSEKSLMIGYNAPFVPLKSCCSQEDV